MTPSIFLQRYKNLTLFQVALKQVHDIVLSRLAFSVEDDITIIFFNTVCCMIGKRPDQSDRPIIINLNCSRVMMGKTNWVVLRLGTVRHRRRLTSWIA
jgi:hypothetical protein